MEILDINIYHKDTNYQYNLMFKIPKLNNDYKIEKAYLKIINQNSNYKGFLGKFNVLFETRKDTLDISISNLMGVFIERDGILTLDEIEISIDVATDKEVRILNSLFLKEPIIIALESNKENKIKLKLDEYDYYLNSTYFYIIHEDEMFLLDNYIYGINDMSYEGFFNNLSIMKKQKTND